VSFAIGVVLTKRYPTPPNRLAATGWQLLIGGAILLPLTAIVEGAPPALTERNLAGFAYLSMVGTALAFIVWFNGIRRLPSAAPPLLGLAAPITGAALGWVASASRWHHSSSRGSVITTAPSRMAQPPLSALLSTVCSITVVRSMTELSRLRNAPARTAVVLDTSQGGNMATPFVSGSIRSVRGADHVAMDSTHRR
jgi:hypothetical protein